MPAALLVKGTEVKGQYCGVDAGCMGSIRLNPPRPVEGGAEGRRRAPTVITPTCQCARRHLTAPSTPPSRPPHLPLISALVIYHFTLWLRCAPHFGGGSRPLPQPLAASSAGGRDSSGAWGKPLLSPPLRSSPLRPLRPPAPAPSPRTRGPISPSCPPFLSLPPRSNNLSPYCPELAVGAIMSWLYLLYFARGFRNVGHFVIMIFRIFTVGACYIQDIYRRRGRGTTRAGARVVCARYIYRRRVLYLP